MKAVQLFSDQYLEASKKLSPTEIARFLEDFRRMQAANEEMTAISIRMPLSLLGAFRARCELENVPYQTKMKALMREWLLRE